MSRTTFAIGYIPPRNAVPRVCIICREPYTAYDKMLLDAGHMASHGVCSPECEALNERIMLGAEPWPPEAA